MLRISVEPVADEDQVETRVESSGSMDDVVAELGLAILRMHEGISQANPMAGFHFKLSVTAMFSDPDFWAFEPKGECLQTEAQITMFPKL